MECHWQSIPSSKCWIVFHCMDRCTASRSLFLWSHILGLCLYRRHLNHLSQRRYELQHIDFVKPENYFLHLCYELSCILLQRLLLIALEFFVSSWWSSEVSQYFSSVHLTPILLKNHALSWEIDISNNSCKFKKKRLIKHPVLRYIFSKLI